ncbi:Bll4347 protein [hydrothermal vent metagenome]|uniref:Bll4347 protein n=1 Tax=hydrothermal vent metagenome TaxID=652676 RepID=A0A3B0RBP7_9ZZZZ
MTAHAKTSKPKTPMDAMKQLGAYPSPQNYELFFTFCQASKPALNKALAPFFDGSEKWTATTGNELYEQYVAKNNLSTVLDSTSEKLGDELKAAMQVLTQAGKEAATYEQALVGAGGNLTDQDDPKSVRQIVDHLVQATAEMQQRSQALETKLADTNQEIKTLQTNLDKVKIEAMTDALSGLANRKRFDEVLCEEAEYATISTKPLALVLCDIDHFKRFNDTWGHQTGDQIIRFVSSTLKRNVGAAHTAARYGGEEFAIIMPATDMEAAVKVADKIRSAIERKKLVRKSTNEDLGKVTISMGVSIFRHTDEVEDIIERADKSLYFSKQNGRNCVNTETQISEEKAA